MHIAMIGSGYVGLVSGACLADFGHIVTCVDKDPERIASLERGQMPIFEPGLEDLVATNVRQKRLHFTTDIAKAVAGAHAVFIAVGTPTRRGDGHADMSYVFAASREIAAAMTGFAVIVTKSTVPVGTGDEVERIISEARPDLEFAVVSNPEFLREGAAISDFKRPDRIVVGAESERAREVMSELYRPLFLNQSPILFTGRRTSELTKYAANAFLATKITFINEMADLCEKVGANVQDVARGIGLDNRIGSKFLHAGPGYGGSCFPKDTLALARTAQEAGAPVRIVETVERVNVERKKRMADRVVAACGGSVDGKKVALLGLAFKPNTDDMRDAPSLDIVASLGAAGAQIHAFDPEAMDQARLMMPGVHFEEDAYACAAGADVLVIVTEWDAFRALDLDAIRAALKTPIVVDLRNIYRPEDMLRRGFTYLSIGRPPVVVERRSMPRP
ncbi:MAG: nucleotide sugar dehydrogenase [Hyphomicrobiales bacterium]|nr:nucleotide sugar dehydrogenase [Hyphomicrobiales bacterium]